MSSVTDYLADREWFTVRVVSPSRARLCLGRLEACGYQYRVTIEDERELRILVRRPELDDIRGLLADLDSGSRSLHSRPSVESHASLHHRMLAAIPLGAGIGAVVHSFFGTPATGAVPAICACLAASIAALPRLAQREPYQSCV